MVQYLLNEIVKYWKSLRSIVGDFESNKKELTKFFDDKISSFFRQIKDDNLSEDLFENLSQLNEASLLFYHFKNTSEELQKLEGKRILMRTTSFRNHQKISRNLFKKKS